MFERMRAALAKRISPFTESGVGGSVVTGGYLVQNPGDQKPGNFGSMRWRKAHEALADISMIAASLRYFNNLTARPAWKCDPPSDKPEAKAAAEFMDSVIQGTDTSWSRTVRRSAIYRFHGFGIHEWTAMKRPDGKIGMASIEPRPPNTIQRWDRDDNGSVIGVWQRNPQTGREVYLPREKIVYLVDDMLSDSPEGLGWYRHMIDPIVQLKRFLKLEALGFERDLSGIPIGRAPISSINALIGKHKVPDGNGGERLFTEADAEDMIRGIKDFVTLKVRQPDTGLLLDSQPFTGTTADGKTVSTALQWGVDLLTGKAESIEALANAVRRINFDMALIMGTESLLVGREGAGSLALSADKSRALALNINSTLGDMAEAYDRDIVGTTWALNGLPEELRPHLRVEDASFKDVEQIGRVLRDMSTAGAILSPDDPAINEVRDLIGLSHQPDLSLEEWGMVRGDPNPENDLPPDDPNADPGKKPAAKPAPKDK